MLWKSAVSVFLSAALAAGAACAGADIPSPGAGQPPQAAQSAAQANVTAGTDTYCGFNSETGSGETLSLLLEKRPELFAAALHGSSAAHSRLPSCEYRFEELTGGTEP